MAITRLPTATWIKWRSEKNEDDSDDDVDDIIKNSKKK